MRTVTFALVLIGSILLAFRSTAFASASIECGYPAPAWVDIDIYDLGGGQFEVNIDGPFFFNWHFDCTGSHAGVGVSCLHCQESGGGDGAIFCTLPDGTLYGEITDEDGNIEHQGYARVDRNGDGEVISGSDTGSHFTLDYH